MGSDIHSQITELRNNLKSDLIKYQNNIGKYMAQAIAKDLTNYAQSVIEDFYDQYDPKDPETHPKRFSYSRMNKKGENITYYKRFYYTRHGNFRDVPQMYYKKRGEIFIGGVDLMDNLPDVYWGAYSDPTQVFNRVIFGGLHGYASLGIPNGIQNIPPIFDPSPYERIKKRHDEIIADHSKYENEAVEKAKKDNYILLFR